jgi:hypothetical protein
VPRVVAEAGRGSDRAPLDLDRRELLETDPVELVRADVQARVLADAGAIARRAVRRGAEARHVAGGRQVAAQ